MWTTLLAAVIVLGPVIVFHEMGHFLVAKLAGIYVKTFSVGFGPKLLRLRFGETEYALSAIPLGGYVRMAGESSEEPAPATAAADPAGAADESGTPAAPPTGPSGEAALYPRDGVRDEDIPPHRWFRNKPIPTRLAVVTAGPIANLILALIVMTGVLWHEGTHVWPTTRIGAIAPESEEAKAGLQNGDRLLALGGKPVANVLDVVRALQDAPAGPLALQLERAGRDTTITLSGVRRKQDVIEFPAWDYQREPIIGQVKKDGPAARAGLRSGDRIVEIDGQPVAHYEDIADHVNPNIGKELSIAWERAGQRLSASVTPEAEEIQDGDSLTKTKKIGRIQIEPYAVVLPVSFADAARESVYRTWRFTADTVRFLGLVVSGRGSRDAVGGPIRIGQVAGSALRWGFSSLLMFMAFFSVNLFLLNMLPIPVLDGGHVVFLLIEAVRGEALSQRVQELLLKVGVSALIALMSYVVLMDFWRVLQR